MSESPAKPATSGQPAKMPQRHQRSIRRRFLRALALAGGIIFISLCIGVLGYHFIAGFQWVDSILNASMILSGMGPVGDLKTAVAKLFASAYALFSGVVFISATGILISPMFHRVLRQFHLDQGDLK